MPRSDTCREFLKRPGREMGTNNRTPGRFVTDVAAQTISKWLCTWPGLSA